MVLIATLFSILATAVSMFVGYALTTPQTPADGSFGSDAIHAAITLFQSFPATAYGLVAVVWLVTIISWIQAVPKKKKA